MASFVGTGHRVYVAHVDLSGAANEVHLGDLTREMKPSTTFNDGGYTCVLPGQLKGSGSVKGNQDFAAATLDSELNTLGAQFPFSVVPSSSGTITAADPCWFTRGIESKYDPAAGAKGDVAGFELGIDFDTAYVRGVVTHPLAARTSTGTGTAVALTGPTAAQRLYSALHVTAYSGLTNVVVKVQTDDNSGFSSATDRITHTTVTGTTSELSSVAGAFASETHVRSSWTVTGSGSISFVHVVGVI